MNDEGRRQRQMGWMYVLGIVVGSGQMLLNTAPGSTLLTVVLVAFVGAVIGGLAFWAFEVREQS